MEAIRAKTRLLELVESFTAAHIAHSVAQEGLKPECHDVAAFVTKARSIFSTYNAEDATNATGQGQQLIIMPALNYAS